MPLSIPLLQRYIFKEVVRVFTFVLSCITILLVFVGIFQQATESGLDPLQTLTIIPYIIPSMLPFTIPAALLLTVSAVYGRLAGDQEVTAAKSAGVHPLSLMWPALLLGALLSIGSLVLTDQVIPWSMAKIEERVVSFMEDIFLDRLRTEHHFSDPKHGLLVTVQGVEGKRLLHPTFRYTKGKKPCTLQAEEAQIDLRIRDQMVIVRARNGWIDIPGQATGRFAGERMEELRWDSDDRESRPREMTIQAMLRQIRSFQSHKDRERQVAAIEASFSLATADFSQLVARAAERLNAVEREQGRTFKLETEVHSRYAMACSCFFFAFLGTPFSMRFGKSQYLTSFLLCFLPIVCGYYPLMLGLTTQAKKGFIGPEWSMWVANAVLALAAWFVMRKVIRY